MYRKSVSIIISLFILFLLAGCGQERESGDIHYKKAKDLEKAGDFKKAALEYRLAVKADPKKYNTIQYNIVYQSIMAYRLNKEDVLYKEYKRKAERHPEDAVYQYLFARLEEDEEKKKEMAEEIIDLYQRV